MPRKLWKGRPRSLLPLACTLSRLYKHLRRKREGAEECFCVNQGGNKEITQKWGLRGTPECSRLHATHIFRRIIRPMHTREVIGPCAELLSSPDTSQDFLTPLLDLILFLFRSSSEAPREAPLALWVLLLFKVPKTAKGTVKHSVHQNHQNGKLHRDRLRRNWRCFCWICRPWLAHNSRPINTIVESYVEISDTRLGELSFWVHMIISSLTKEGYSIRKVALQ